MTLAADHEAATDTPYYLIPPTPDLIPVARVREAIVLRNEWDTHILAQAPTCQVRLRLTSPYWTFEALNEHGHRKTCGGDEFYVCCKWFNVVSVQTVCRIVPRQKASIDSLWMPPRQSTVVCSFSSSNRP
jgi:hypothetical protein